MEILFRLERETKGALRYEELGGDGNPVEIGEGAQIGTLYVRKDAATAAFNGFPSSILLTITKVTGV